MELPQLAVDTYAAICLVIITPWLYQTFKPFSTERTKSRTDQSISTLLLIHTLYILYGLLVSPPQNIFKALGFKLDVAPELLREKVVEMFGGEENVPAHLIMLLRRMGLADLRLLYVRFGHDVLTTCSYCHSYGDFALYAFPGPLLEYIREIAFLGLLTLPKRPTAPYRPLALGALLGALLTEGYWVLTVGVRFPSSASPDAKVTMWHDLFVLLRHSLFLVLPLLITVLPSLGLHRLPFIGPFFPSPDPQTAGLPPASFQMHGQQITLPADATLMSASALTLQTLGHLVPTLHLYKYAQAAAMRLQSPAAEGKTAPQARTTRWWAAEATEGRIVREDEGVRKILKGAGLSVEPAVVKDGEVVEPDGPLLNSAKVAVAFLREQGAKPSGLWAPSA